MKNISEANSFDWRHFSVQFSSLRVKELDQSDDFLHQVANYRGGGVQIAGAVLQKIFEQLL